MAVTIGSSSTITGGLVFEAGPPEFAIFAGGIGPTNVIQRVALEQA